MILSLEDIMTKKVTTIGKNESLYYARFLMDSEQVRHLPVIDENNELVGIITNRDIRTLDFSKLSDIPVSERSGIQEKIPIFEVMNKNVVSIKPDADLLDATNLMLEKKIGCLPVVNYQNQVVGIITESDYIKITKQFIEFAERQRNLSSYF